MAKLNEYLTVAQAASYIGVSADTLRRWDRAEKLLAHRHPVTNYRLYLRRELDDFLRKVGAEQKKAVSASGKSGSKRAKVRRRKRRV